MCGQCMSLSQPDKAISHHSLNLVSDVKKSISQIYVGRFETIVFVASHAYSKVHSCIINLKIIMFCIPANNAPLGQRCIMVTMVAV